MGLTVHFEVLNQLGTPMMYSDTLANRPSAGITGRIFYRTDSPYGIYRDNGSSWDQIAGSGGGAGVTGSGTATRVAFWDSSSSISSNANLYWDNTNSRLGINTATPGVALDIHSTGTAAHFNGTGTNNSYILFQNAGSGKWQIGNTYSAGTNYFRIYDSVNAVERLKIQNDGQLTTTTNITASGSSTGYQGIYNANTVNIPASTSFPSGGYVYAGMNDYYYQIFAGNATFQNNNINSAYFGINRIDFSSTGTITMTQASGVRAMAAAMFQNQYNGTSSGTITHLAGAQILGNFRSAGSGTLTVTNGYGLLINNLDDYGAGFTFTNRFGIYQEGTNDKNYFAGITLIGTSSSAGSYALQVTGQIRLNSYLTSTSYTGTAAGYLAFDSSGNIITSSGPTGTNIYNSDGTLTGDRTLTNSSYLLKFVGGKEITTNEQTALRLETSTTSKELILSLNNLSGKNYLLRSLQSGNFDIRNVTDGINAISISGRDVTITGNFIAGNSAQNSIANVSTLDGLWLSQSTRSTSNYSIYSDSTRTFLNSNNGGIFFRNQNANQGTITANSRFILGSVTEDASAIMKLDSTASGFLPPRMTTTQKNAIGTPAAGLIVFDITLSKLCVYSGSAWQTITSV